MTGPGIGSHGTLELELEEVRRRVLDIHEATWGDYICLLKAKADALQRAHPPRHGSHSNPPWTLDCHATAGRCVLEIRGTVRLASELAHAALDLGERIEQHPTDRRAPLHVPHLVQLLRPAGDVHRLWFWRDDDESLDDGELGGSYVLATGDDDATLIGCARGWREP